MEPLTYQELKERLENECLTDWVDSDISIENESQPREEFGEVKQVDTGGFASESYYSSVKIFRTYHFVDHGIYIRFDGYLSSYEGCEYDGMEQVQPVEKTVIVYETINN